MINTITITLVKPLIIETVKNETFHKGNIDKAIDPKAVTLAYQEQAGNEAYHERIIERGLYLAVEELKTNLAEYISTSGYTTADNSIDSSDDGNNIIINLKVSDRFNRGFTQSLARLSSAYVENSILMDWWKTINEKQSALYAQFVDRNLAAIKRCFNKTAPTAPSVPYTSYLRTTGSAIELEIGEVATVTYEISDGAIDDIECRVEDRTLIDTGRSEEGFVIKGRQRGHTYIELYSRHNPELTRKVHVYITEHT